jgi:hypothetical protein
VPDLSANSYAAGSVQIAGYSEGITGCTPCAGLNCANFGATNAWRWNSATTWPGIGVIEPVVAKETLRAIPTNGDLVTACQFGGKPSAAQIIV